MKIKRLFLIIISMVIISSTFFVSPTYASDEVQFECEKLKAAFVEIIGKDVITIEDMSELSGKLDLSYKNIESISGLENAINVSDLVLSFNNISDISPLTSLTNLKSLYLDYNWITTLPQDNMGLTYLEHIDISNNDIETIPDLFFDMPSIRRIYMGDMALNVAPNLSYAADTLDRLDISGANLQSFDFITSLTNLELLILNDCGLSKLPNVSTLNKLGYLYFSDNEISELPDYLSTLPLIRLDFSGNYISQMPQSYANLKRLEQLVMTDNYFKILPDAVTYMDSLEVLMCGQNIIEDVPESIVNLQNIKRASFASNNLTTINKFINFEIPYSYQISFKYNYLDLNDATNIDVLNGYKNSGGTQKSAYLQAIPTSATADNLTFECSFDMGELAKIGENAQLSSLELFKKDGDKLVLLTQVDLTYYVDGELKIEYQNAKEGQGNYLLCLEVLDGSLSQKVIKYTVEIDGVVVSPKATMTQSPTTIPSTATPTAQPTQVAEDEGKIFPKYLLYILLLGVIIIISAIILHFVQKGRK